MWYDTDIIQDPSLEKDEGTGGGIGERTVEVSGRKWEGKGLKEMLEIWERERGRERRREREREREREWQRELERMWERVWEWERERERQWERERERQWEEERERTLLSLRLFLQSILLAFLSPASIRVPMWKKRLKSASVCMPWAIPPTLLILWSVVWMFLPTPDGNTSSDRQEQLAAISPPDPFEIAPPLSWVADTSIQNYYLTEQPWPVFDFVPGAGSVQVDGSYPANSAYLGGYGGDVLLAGAPNSFALHPLLDLLPNCNFPFDWSALSNDTLTSSSTDFTSGALFESSEPHAIPLLPAAQGLQTHASIKTNINISEHNGRQKRARKTTTKVLCTQCDKRFDSQKDVDRHTKGVHEGRKDYTCDAPGCRYKFSRKDNLQRHKRSHGIGNDSARDTSTGSSASPKELGTPTTAQSGAKKRRHDEIIDVEGLSREESVVRPSNERLTREELEQRLKEMEDQLHEERLKGIGAEDNLKTREGLEHRVKEMENQLREERLMRIELEDTVEGVQNEMRKLKEDVSTLQGMLART